ncbi:solute carrier family 23 member 1 [Aplysia californica]|uniref:Solute carrier family 23 member 1 n=1 Tax=Aplysia californica TaxID=6500 RepID=A0ABM0JNX8_APLCA|nr:solute carrier family 23 member 1 [Aplysia californica]
MTPKDEVSRASESCEKNKDGKDGMLYRVDDNPSWILCILLGFQHYLTAFGSTLSVPLILAGPLCMGGDTVGLSELIATMFFASGITTILQTSIGVRLPIIQGATFALLAPTQSILSLPEWTCPSNISASNISDCVGGSGNSSVCADPRELWYPRIREVQGAICVASLFQVVIGCSGVLSFFLRYIGPLTIAPTITLIGLSLFEVAAYKASSHWWISITTIVLIAIFSQYLKNIDIPVPSMNRGKSCSVIRLPVFKLFPVLIAMVLSWLLCLALTLGGALPDEPGSWGYMARTDVSSSVLADSPWIRIPYSGQWGMPTVSAGAVFGMLAGVLASMMESVGDYYACARLAEAPPPPPNAVNRGIAVEGVCCIITGLLGTGNGSTSYSENVGAIGITKVGSRRVVFTAGVLLILLGCLGKVGALFVTIPEPVVGGMFISMFGMITAVGLSNLHFVDLTSTRNLFVIACSLFFGLCFPHWMSKQKHPINVGVPAVDQILTVLLSTSMFVGGFIGFLLDVTLPGTLKERGMLTWRSEVTSNDKGEMVAENRCDDKGQSHIYDIPFLQKYIDRIPACRYVPVFVTKSASGEETGAMTLEKKEKNDIV